jgi:hypothetical protein
LYEHFFEPGVTLRVTAAHRLHTAALACDLSRIDHPNKADGPMVSSQLAVLRRRIATLFDDAQPPARAAQVVNAALALLIVVNVTGVILESVPALHERYAAYFDGSNTR